MYSTIFFLLAACCVAVFSEKLEVHVTGVTSDYKILEFKGARDASKTFRLGKAETDDTHVKVMSDAINEMELNVGICVTSASILGVTQPNILIPLDITCTPAKTCLKINGEPFTGTYDIYVKGIKKEHKTMTCTTRTGKKVIKLDETATVNGQSIQVQNGAISKVMFQIGLGVLECRIDEGVLLETIPLKKLSNCSAVEERCFKTSGTYPNPPTGFETSVISDTGCGTAVTNKANIRRAAKFETRVAAKSETSIGTSPSDKPDSPGVITPSS